LRGLNWRTIALPILGLGIISILTGIVSWGVFVGCQRIWGTEGLWLQLGQLAITGLIGSGVFMVCLIQLRLPEVDLLAQRIRQKFTKKSREDLGDF
jgi:putative peptidoglycan lipid II flippase